MLPRTSRLRASEVAQIIREGVSARGRFLSAKFMPSQDGTMRAASVVSKSLAQNAVRRNALRRALYQALRESPAPPVNLVLFLRTIPPKPLLPALRTDLQSLFASLRR